MKQLGWTTLEQSKKLVEAGLDPNTADMSIFEAEGKQYVYAHKPDDINCTPCWSLGALLTLMPKAIPHRRCHEEGKEYWTYNWHLTPCAIYYGCGIIDNSLNYDYESLISFNYKDNPIEAAYNMVIWLLENGYIKKEETK